MAKTTKSNSFRNKPRNRKKVVCEEPSKPSTSGKRGLVIHTTKTPESGRISVRFNEKELKELLLLKEIKEYSSNSLTIKEAIRFMIHHEVWLKRKAEVLRKERLDLGIPLKWLE